MNPTLHNWKAARRVQAWSLKPQGWPQRQIAEALGVSEGAVRQWMTRAREGGPDALRHRPPPGAPRRLSAAQLTRLPELLHRGPEAGGFRGHVWTRGRIAAVLQLEYGMSYHSRHVGRLCQAIRWSPQKPASARPSARRRGDCPRARGDLAGHQQGAETQQHTLLFVDEAGFSPCPSVVRTSAPVGQTPIVREWWTRDHLSAISALSLEGKRYFHSQDGALKSEAVIAFLEHLRREVQGRLGLIGEGAPIHRSRTVKEFLANGAAQRRHLERLPAHAPELNPDEGLWQPLKGVERRHLCGFPLPHLRREWRDAVKRVRRKPRLITSVFRGAKL